MLESTIESLQSAVDEPWKPVAMPALIAWLTFYVGFMIYAFSAHGGFLFIDSANLVVHEGGHNLFYWFGPTLGLWGGTLLQWLVPFLLAAYFFIERQTVGFVFCLFFFFENWLYTATYMADARAQVLPLVTTGDPDFVEHEKLEGSPRHAPPQPEPNTQKGFSALSADLLRVLCV